jgi:hypothetical protein
MLNKMKIFRNKDIKLILISITTLILISSALLGCINTSDKLRAEKMDKEVSEIKKELESLKEQLLTAYGSNNILDSTAESQYEESISYIEDNTEYKVQKGNWYVISWIENELIYYSKTVVGTNSINSFVFHYPKAGAKLYNPMVEHINNSFKPGNLKEAH